MLKELIEKCRTYRRFDESRGISDSILISFIKNAVITPSGANLQPLKYKLVTDGKDREELFGTLKWAGYLTDWQGPADGEKPSAYIIILGDTVISKKFSTDLGISAYAIVLSAAELGIGSCMIGSVDREHVREYFKITDRYEILLIVALGYPAEKVVLEKTSGDDIRYYRDDRQVHHVPKRSSEDVII